MKEHTIETARVVISHTTDGPVTDFVLMFRACEIATKRPGFITCTPDIATEALYAELKERGFLAEEAESDQDRETREYLERLHQSDRDQSEADADAS
jgi:hypothetical protein